MNGYEERKKLYRKVVSKELCRVIELKWSYPFLSEEYNKLEVRNFK